LQELWQLVALEFALALLTDGLNRMINLQIVYWAICSNYTSIRIMKHAATLDLDQFEDSVLR
jgi:ATP-binding cassette subfamily B protein